MKKPAVLLIILLFLSSVVHSSELVSFFNDRFIPVEEIIFEGDTVVVTYLLSPLIDQEKVGGDLMLIFGKLAHEYPDSKNILLNCQVGEETALAYQVGTGDILDYVGGDINDEEVINRITFQDFRDELEEKGFGGKESFQLPDFLQNFDLQGWLEEINWESKKDVVYLIIGVAIILIVFLLSVGYLVRVVFWFIKKILSFFWSILCFPFRRGKKGKSGDVDLVAARQLISQALKEKEITRDKAEELLRDLEDGRITSESIEVMFSDM